MTIDFNATSSTSAKRRKLLGAISLGLLTGGGLTLNALAAVPNSKHKHSRKASRAMKLFYSPAYVGSAHAFETTRKAKWVAESLASKPIAHVSLIPNAPLTSEALLLAHEKTYVEAVRTGQPRALAQSQGFDWDPGLWSMVLASNGGVLAAAHNALKSGVAGSLSSGLHHARRDHGAGFCTFNGLAVAALDVLRTNVKRVLIIDLDAHCGGGTHSILAKNPAVRILDIAVDAFDQYQPQGANTLDLIDDASQYLSTLRTRLAEIRSQPFDLCLYNAGMDPFEGCPIGGLPGITQEILAQREAMVFAWCKERKLSVAFVLAGGYIGPRISESKLVDLHRLTLTASASAFSVP